MCQEANFSKTGMKIGPTWPLYQGEHKLLENFFQAADVIKTFYLKNA